MITKSEFDQERFNLVLLGFELKLCRIKLRKCIMQRNAVFLGKSFFYEYAFVLIKRRTGFSTTFKRDCPINFFLETPHRGHEKTNKVSKTVDRSQTKLQL